MEIIHIAMWTNDLEKLKNFYLKFFQGKSNKKYSNKKKGFSSYFINFDSNVKLEIMNRTDITQEKKYMTKKHLGFNTLSFSVGSKKNINKITTLLKNEGHIILKNETYESIILDPDGNKIKIKI